MGRKRGSSGVARKKQVEVITLNESDEDDLTQEQEKSNDTANKGVSKFDPDKFDIAPSCAATSDVEIRNKSNLAATAMKKNAKGQADPVDKVKITQEENHQKCSRINEQGVSYDVIVPNSMVSGTDSGCTVLVQIDPTDQNGGKDQQRLEFEGSGGVIGRFEADANNGITLDFKGYQYLGTVRPGPTALVVSLSKSHSSGGSAVVAKVDGITDEFVTLSQTRDNMAMLDAVVERGEMDGSYLYEDVDVNAMDKSTSNRDNDSERGKEKKGRDCVEGSSNAKGDTEGRRSKKRNASSKRKR